MRILPGFDLTHHTLMQLAPGIAYLADDKGDPLVNSVKLAIALQTIPYQTNTLPGVLPPTYSH
jgi:hypothetical protein